ncbi:ABC transporter permease subunit [Thorsellia kenyensis]|uniref:ABC transporter permease subunit n=1 Tax=Thorsellia kenyensis TaxID=1549888 RepID=A0ABV6CDB7_9GAMM
MLKLIFKKIITLFPTFIGITLITFLLVHLIPGDPVLLMSGERGLSEERHAQLLAEYGLDKPLHQQYISYIQSLLQGDLGQSIKTKKPVWDEFVPKFKATLELALCALLLAIAVGIPLGVIAAVKRGSFLDHATITLSLTGYSMPIFWWGMMLILVMSIHLNLTPVSGRIDPALVRFPRSIRNDLTGFMLIDTWLYGKEGYFKNAVSHLILPTIVLSTIPLAVIVRMTRSSMLEVLNEDYIRTARAKGLSKWRVIVIHALRNALMPVITVIGLQLGVLLSGAVLTEYVFSWPGVGTWLIDSLERRDYPVIQGGVLIVATLIILVNLVVDILYGYINPKVRNH